MRQQSSGSRYAAGMSKPAPAAEMSAWLGRRRPGGKKHLRLAG
jgi:hypothetical protein